MKVIGDEREEGWRQPHREQGEREGGNERSVETGMMGTERTKVCMWVI